MPYPQSPSLIDSKTVSNVNSVFLWPFGCCCKYWLQSQLCLQLPNGFMVLIKSKRTQMKVCVANIPDYNNPCYSWIPSSYLTLKKLSGTTILWSNNPNFSSTQQHTRISSPLLKRKMLSSYTLHSSTPQFLPNIKGSYKYHNTGKKAASNYDKSNGGSQVSSIWTVTFIFMCATV